MAQRSLKGSFTDSCYQHLFLSDYLNSYKFPTGLLVLKEKNDQISRDRFSRYFLHPMGIDAENESERSKLSVDVIPDVYESVIMK